THPRMVPTGGPPVMRSKYLQRTAVRVMGNLVTDEDVDLTARAWRTAGRLSMRADEPMPFSRTKARPGRGPTTSGGSALGPPLFEEAAFAAEHPAQQLLGERFDGPPDQRPPDLQRAGDLDLAALGGGAQVLVAGHGAGDAGGRDPEVAVGGRTGQRPPVVGAVEDEVAGEHLAHDGGDAVLAGAFGH